METCCDSFDSHIQICENPECKDRLIDFAVIPTLKEILPVGYRHLVCYCASNSDDHKHFEATVRINLSSRQDAEKWKNSFRETSKITLRVRRTLPTSLTKVIYKVEYKCQHNTQPRTLLAKTRKSSKNTNCPSTVFVTVYNTEFFNYEGHRRRIRSSDCHRTEFPALVKIRYCHNHPVNTASSLKFRDVSEKARSRVEQLILQGYSPVATLEMYHFDLQMEYGNDYVYLCSDRAFCPDKDFVYRMFYKLSNQKCRERQRTEITQLKDHVDNLERCLQKQSSDDSTLSLFGCEADSQESLIMEDCQTSAPTASAADLQRSCVKKYLDMEVTEEGQLILVVCTPLMHRVHKLLPHSQQMVFMDGTGSVDRNHCRVFLLLTHSCVGGLPLGVIVTTSESPQTIKRGLELLCSLIGEAGFGGRGRKGPAIFMTNDSKAERAGIEEVFPEAVIFLSVFHILRTFWRYLWDSKNGVAVLHRPAMFGLLKGMVYASSVEELNAQYKYKYKYTCD